LKRRIPRLGIRNILNAVITFAVPKFKRTSPDLFFKLETLKNRKLKNAIIIDPVAIINCIPTALSEQATRTIDITIYDNRVERKNLNIDLLREEFFLRKVIGASKAFNLDFNKRLIINRSVITVNSKTTYYITVLSFFTSSLPSIQPEQQKQLQWEL